MNADRIKEIQSKTAYPESQSVAAALMQVWNECAQEEQGRQKSLGLTFLNFTALDQKNGLVMIGTGNIRRAIESMP